MKIEDLKIGMEVKLRKNINKCNYDCSLEGYGVTDIDLHQYKGSDVVTVDDYSGWSTGMAWVVKEGAMPIKINPKHLRKI